MMKNIHAESSQIRLTKAKYEHQERWEGVNAKVPTHAAGYDDTTDEEGGPGSYSNSPVKRGGVVFKNGGNTGRPPAVVSPGDVIAAAATAVSSGAAGATYGIHQRSKSLAPTVHLLNGEVKLHHAPNRPVVKSPGNESSAFKTLSRVEVDRRNNLEALKIPGFDKYTPNFNVI